VNEVSLPYIFCARSELLMPVDVHQANGLF